MLKEEADTYTYMGKKMRGIIRDAKHGSPPGSTTLTSAQTTTAQRRLTVENAEQACRQGQMNESWKPVSSCMSARGRGRSRGEVYHQPEQEGQDHLRRGLRRFGRLGGHLAPEGEQLRRVLGRYLQRKHAERGRAARSSRRIIPSNNRRVASPSRPSGRLPSQFVQRRHLRRKKKEAPIPTASSKKLFASIQMRNLVTLEHMIVNIAACSPQRAQRRASITCKRRGCKCM